MFIFQARKQSEYIHQSIVKISIIIKIAIITRVLTNKKFSFITFFSVVKFFLKKFEKYAFWALASEFFM